MRVYCIAYDDPTPHMDGIKRIRMGEWESQDRALESLALVTLRSERAPKRNLRIETREVTEWVPLS